MKVRCSGCRAKYRVPDESVEKRSARITCKRCKAQLRISHLGAEVEGGTIVEPYAGQHLTVEHRGALSGGRPAAPRAPVTPPDEVGPDDETNRALPRQVTMAPPERSFFVSVNGQPRGPYRASTVRDLVEKGKLKAETWACATDTQRWVPIGDLEELRGMFSEPTVATGTPPASMPDFTSPPLSDPILPEDLVAQQPAYPPADPRADPLNPAGGRFGEGTRVALMEAGVLGREEKHARWGKTAAVLAAGVVFGFVTVGGIGWWFWIHRPAEEKAVKQDQRIVLTLDDMDADAATEYAFLTGERRPSEEPRRRKRRRKRTTPTTPTTPDDGTRSSDDDAAEEVRGLLDDDGKRRATPEAPKEAALVEQAGGLDSAAVRAVYKQNRNSLGHCVQQAAKSGTMVAGKHSAVLAVEVSGKVTEVKISAGPLKGSELGGCLAKTLRRWRFPPFAGGTTEVEIPIVLAPG